MMAPNTRLLAYFRIHPIVPSFLSFVFFYIHVHYTVIHILPLNNIQNEKWTYPVDGAVILLMFVHVKVSY